jgi:hypothetical protein
MRAEPVGDAFLDRSDCSKVEAAIDALHGLFNGLQVRHIADDQCNGGGQIVAVAGGQVVKDADAIPAGDQRLA